MRACLRRGEQPVPHPEIQYIRVLRMPHGSLDIEKAEHNYAPESVPEKGYFYMPVQCQQCKNPPCVKVCPVHATWQETDGITVVDYDWCIGCRYCEAACPYWAGGSISRGPRSQRNGSTLKWPIWVTGPAHGRDGEMPFLHPAHPGGPVSRVPGSLSRRRAEVRQHSRSEQRGGLHPADQAGLHPAQGGLGTSPRFFYYFDV